MAGQPENKYGLDLRRAWAQVKEEVRRADIPDILDWADYPNAWPQWEQELADALNRDTYAPSRPIVVDLPKDEFATRPIALLTPKDWVYYQALVDQIAPAIDDALSDSVYSARLRQRRPARTQVRRQITAWIAFEKAGLRLYEDDGFQHAITTDVSSYFEYIDIATLSRDLKALPGVDQIHVNLLSGLLNAIQRNTSVWGIPQGPECSSILGNFYLVAADTTLFNLGVKHVRFQDDIKMFSHSIDVLRVALRDLIRVLRDRHLNLAFYKTELLSGDQIRRAFEDDRKTAISYGIDIDDPNVDNDIHAFFKDATRKPPYKARDIRFIVARLRVRRDPLAIPWILDHLEQLPYLAPLLVRYLGPHMIGRPEIEDRLREVLSTPTATLYGYTEIHLLRVLGRASNIQPATRHLVWAIARDQNKDAHVRAFAIRCLGRHAALGDIQVLRTMFTQSTDHDIRRALLVAIHEGSHTAPDHSWLGSVSKESPDLSPTCEYLRAAPTHIPL